MKQKVWQQIACIAVMIYSFQISAQKAWYHPVDTLKGFNNGISLDSADIDLLSWPSTFTLGYSTIQNANWLNPEISANGFLYHPKYRNLNFTYSGIPHLELGYSFGSTGLQNARVRYQQVIDTNHLLNFNFSQDKGNGVLRNSAYNQTFTEFGYLGNWKRYHLKTAGNYFKTEAQENGGITSDSLIEITGVELLPIRMVDAQALVTGGRFKIEQQLDFVAQERITLGLKSFHDLRIWNRKFTETVNALDALPINIDSSLTKDQIQWGEFQNFIGLSGRLDGFSFSSGAALNAWRLDNLGIRREVQELNWISEVYLGTRFFDLYANLDVNIVGAEQEWRLITKASKRLHKLSFNLEGEVSQQLPEPYQRGYFGNYLDTVWSTYQKEVRQYLQLDLGYSIHSRLTVGAKIGYFAAQNPLIWDGNFWSNTVFNQFSVLEIQPRAIYRGNLLHLDASYRYATSDFSPNHLVELRTAIQGRIFKGKKLLSQIGIHSMFAEDFNLLTYDPRMGTFMLPSSVQSFNAQFNLHPYLGFEVTQFRFYFRCENLGYLWNNRSNQVVQNHPINRLLLRAGITWEFFN